MSKSLRINLVNAREISSFFDMESESPAIATILRLLYEVGLSAVTFPDCEESCDILNYEINIESFFKKNPADIIGFSCWTSGYGIAVDMASVARRVCSNAIIVAGKVKALIKGRYNVSYTDINELAFPVLRHRLKMNFEAIAERVTADDAIRMILEEASKNYKFEK